MIATDDLIQLNNFVFFLNSKNKPKNQFIVNSLESYYTKQYQNLQIYTSFKSISFYFA